MIGEQQSNLTLEQEEEKLWMEHYFKIIHYEEEKSEYLKLYYLITN